MVNTKDKENLRFSAWLQAEMDKRKWTQTDLSKSAKEKGHSIAQAMISYVLNGKNDPTPRFCEAIAVAFDMSVIEVYEVAGVMLEFTKELNGNGVATKVSDIARKLPKDKQDELLRYAKYLLSGD